mmetsp:Transcript_25062/g.79082  ORF Transcript_25062/g.79082 Transcript_25062/m.79082 type:complete len:220 (+) Transcript_25062:905-1564(+)|eukprot:scaffold13606_cov118-Isochrysis_galbana.AAC.4
MRRVAGARWGCAGAGCAPTAVLLSPPPMPRRADRCCVAAMADGVWRGATGCSGAWGGRCADGWTPGMPGGSGGGGSSCRGCGAWTGCNGGQLVCGGGGTPAAADCISCCWSASCCCISCRCCSSCAPSAASMVLSPPGSALAPIGRPKATGCCGGLAAVVPASACPVSPDARTWDESEMSSAPSSPPPAPPVVATTSKSSSSSAIAGPAVRSTGEQPAR